MKMAQLWEGTKRTIEAFRKAGFERSDFSARAIMRRREFWGVRIAVYVKVDPSKHDLQALVNGGLIVIRKIFATFESYQISYSTSGQGYYCEEDYREVGEYGLPQSTVCEVPGQNETKETETVETMEIDSYEDAQAHVQERYPNLSDAQRKALCDYLWSFGRAYHLSGYNGEDFDFGKTVKCLGRNREVSPRTFKALARLSLIYVYQDGVQLTPTELRELPIKVWLLSPYYMVRLNHDVFGGAGARYLKHAYETGRELRQEQQEKDAQWKAMSERKRALTKRLRDFLNDNYPSVLLYEVPLFNDGVVRYFSVSCGASVMRYKQGEWEYVVKIVGTHGEVMDKLKPGDITSVFADLFVLENVAKQLEKLIIADEAGKIEQPQI
jgi:hypothetical protein